MASIGNIQLFNGVAMATNSISGTKATELHQTDYKAMLKLENTSGATVSGKIEHSPDGGSWEDLATFTGLSADGIESVDVTSHVYPIVRANLTVAGGTADVSCFLWFDKRGK